MDTSREGENRLRPMHEAKTKVEEGVKSPWA